MADKKPKPPAVHIVDGNGLRAISITPAPKSVRAVHVLDGEDWKAIPRSDVTLKGAQLVLSATPSGIYQAWPKGQANVKVSE